MFEKYILYKIEIRLGYKMCLKLTVLDWVLDSERNKKELNKLFVMINFE